MRPRAMGGSLAVALVLLLWAVPAQAQVSTADTPSVSLERLWLQPGEGSFIGAQDARLLLPGRLSFQALASFMRRPIVFRNIVTGELATVPVEQRLGYELAVARGLSERFQLGVALPVVAAQDGDRLQGIGLSEESLRPVALGDLRVHGKLSLLEELEGPLRFALSMSLTLPTGDEDHFAGEASFVAAWFVVASYRAERFRLATNLGGRLRAEEVSLLSPARPHGNELSALVAGEWMLPEALEVDGALMAEAAKVLGDNDGPSPGEVRLGVSGRVASRHLLKAFWGRGVGKGEVGAPDWRVGLLFEWRRSPSD